MILPNFDTRAEVKLIIMKKEKLSSDQLEVFNKIDHILYNDWNPIGVPDLPRDEYQDYTSQIFKLKIQGSAKAQIAEYLHKLEKNYMGLKGSLGHCEKIADLIIEI